MAITGWHLVRLVAEAQRDLIGSTLEGTALDLESGTIVFQLGSRRGKRWLVIRVRGSSPAFYWLHDRSFFGSDRYKSSERFNRAWRGTLTKMALPITDRVITLDFERVDAEMTRLFRLYLSWAGNSGNIHLVSLADQTVLETLWESKANPPGHRFKLPAPPSFIDWRTVTLPEFVAARNAAASLNLSNFLAKSVWGIDRALATHLESVASQEAADWNTPRGKWAIFSTILSELRRVADPVTPIVAQPTEEGTIGYLPALPDSTGDIFTALSECMAHTQAEAGDNARRENALNNVRQAVTKSAKTLRKRLGELERAIAGEQESITIKRHADLLGAQRNVITRGANSARIQDWETGEEIAIVLDPALGPQENIEAIYKRARKLANAAAHARDELSALEIDLKRMSGFESELMQPEIDEARALAIAEELGIAPRKAPSPRTQQQRRLPYREFQVGKYSVLVGRSSRDNDELTKHIARPGDLFLHADKVGGSHVILRRPGKSEEFPTEAIVAAAQIAAFFSKARHSTLVSVIYADVRHVTKPRKAPPGLVRVSNEKSLMVRPLAPPGYHE